MATRFKKMTLDQTTTTDAGEDIISLDEVLPGFRLTVDELFQPLRIR